MNNVQLSEHIRANYPLTSRSIKLKKAAYGEFVNDADYIVSPMVDGKQKRCPAYQKWVSMVLRCNHQGCLKRRPTYSNSIICDEWKSFMSFRAWWIKNQVDGWQLDKDLLVPGNKTYSPDTCVFVPLWLNTFLCDQGKNRGAWPIGVCFTEKRNRFSAYCRDPIRKRGVTIGRYKTLEEARDAYVSTKLMHAESLKCEIDKIDPRLFASIKQIIESRRYD